ncbi:hypothetical protein TH1_105 [Shewanella phage Thanatos-1]|nr:hypothetical protein TH1_105 [Shewanella phage Thanatos-1]
MKPPDAYVNSSKRSNLVADPIHVVESLIVACNDSRPDITVKHIVGMYQLNCNAWSSFSRNHSYPISVTDYCPKEEYSQYESFKELKIIAGKRLACYLIGRIIQSSKSIGDKSVDKLSFRIKIIKFFNKMKVDTLEGLLEDYKNGCLPTESRLQKSHNIINPNSRGLCHLLYDFSLSYTKIVPACSFPETNAIRLFKPSIKIGNPCMDFPIGGLEEYNSGNLWEGDSLKVRLEYAEWLIKMYSSSLTTFKMIIKW